MYKLLLMIKRSVTLLLLFVSANLFAQKLDKLSVEKIMRDPKWMGSSPSNTFWSNDGTTLYFLWNPDKEPTDSTWYVTTTNKIPVKATAAQKQALASETNYNYNEARTAYVFAKDGDVIYKDIKTGKVKLKSPWGGKPSRKNVSRTTSITLPLRPHHDCGGLFHRQRNFSHAG